ncbi:FlgM family anti-sigma-28 factor [Lachnotalea glycerini]|jgi:negative regulator of flagellin synthesis FlgM|uniref:Negative regulator of flagellin synthesis n=1 Tax=Lachnotalea glycerini TaxID=1763509 RepID=A0A255IED5_9FIRM|nr:flagellar biosynthesis anti-sigma factor FlgM [Lachnotalea glycerini]PXV90227.1 FlgM family anti-sigma-28 factor [Lachnotalea glycerini]RDY30624.1 flagellar biosynthesis anti-sigma factor FlgM [Lachnotalea glycerini]
MRIEAYNQISQVYNTEKANNIKQNMKASQNDKLEISQQARDYQIAKNAVAQTDDVREDLVAKYKAEIQSGEYEVSADDFANKVIESYNKLML